MKHKVLVLGDVNGQIKAALGKIAAHHQKQNFAFAIIAGNLFASDEQGIATITEDVETLLSGSIDVTLPIYFTLGRQILPERLIEKLEQDNGELCTNLLAIGRRGRVKTTDGISIVAISGIHSPDDEHRPESWYAGGYSDKEASTTISYNRADILITSDWPKDITAGSDRLSSDAGVTQSYAIANVCASLKPRYHFSASGTSFEREQFYHDAEGYPVTNFLSLAPFGSPAGQKAMFAFSLEIPQPVLTTPPVNVAKAPFRSGKPKRGLATQDDAFNEYRFSNGGQLEERRGKRRKKLGPLMPDECFFCLSNPKVEDHMIASIGGHSYVTVPKGPLPKDNTFPDLGFPGHLLVIPTNHVPTLAAVVDEAERASISSEMDRFKSAIQKTLAANAKNEQSKLGTVTWEVSRAGNVHLHWQVMAMPAELISNGSIVAAFQEEAATKHYPPFETEEGKVAAVEEGNCFKVELWTESSSNKIALALDETFKFNLQLGRAVLGKLLGLPGRADWKSCGQSKASEEADVAKFQSLFKDFDFTQDGV